MDRDEAPPNLAEVVADLRDTANDLHIAADSVQVAEQRAEAAEDRAKIAEAITEMAQADIDAATARAAEIERAALETVLGQRITSLENEVRQWQESAIQNLQMQIAELMAPILTELQLLVKETEELTEELPSTPPNSEAEIVPEQLPELKEPEKSQENPAPQKPRKVRRWI